MDIWNIYSIGDAYYLSQVLNAIAAICGTADFTSACAIALLVGVIIICVQTVIRGQGFPIQTAVICYVFWFICYYPTTSVNIHDVYTQTDRKADNVPLGPAAIGSVVSTIGFKVTEMMETAFQMPTNSSTLTGSGAGNGGRYGNALYYLNNSLRLGSSPKMTLSLDEVNGDTDGDFYRSMSDYVRFCTFRAVQLGPNWGGKTAEQINNLPASEALKFDSKVYYTQVWTKGKPEDVNCSDGWAKILDKYKNALDLGSGSDVFADLIMRTGAVPETDPATAKQTAMALDIKVLTQGALESLRVDSSNSQYFMLGSLARDIYRAGMARGYNDYHDRQTAIMLNQAIAQRNVQWAAEQSMFFDSMRPMLSFVEGFVYAITPFAAFIMLLGVFGLSLYFKYFMMIVWIQLWLPAAAICNMFIMSGATRQLSEFAVSNKVTSFYALDSIAQVAGTWVSVGGMFTAAIPVLTFIIISGSAYALTSLAGRMAGSDHINEKIVSPNIVDVGAAASVAPLYHGDSMKMTLSGAENLMPTINVGQQAQQAAQIASSSVIQQTHSLVDTVSTGFEQTYGKNAGTKMGEMLTDLSSSAGTTGLSSAISRTKAAALSQGFQVTDQQAAALTVGAGGGFSGASVAGAMLGLKENVTTTNGRSMIDAFNALKNSGFSLNSQESAALTNAISSSLNKNSEKGESFSEMGKLARTVNDSNADIQSDAHTAAVSQQVADSYGITSSVNVNDLVGKWDQNTKNKFNKEYSEYLNSLSQDERNIVESSAKSYSQYEGLSTGGDDTAAKVAALLTLGGSTDGVMRGKELVFSTLGEGTPHFSQLQNMSSISADVQSETGAMTPVSPALQQPSPAEQANQPVQQSQSPVREAPSKPASKISAPDGSAPEVRTPVSPALQQPSPAESSSDPSFYHGDPRKLGREEFLNWSEANRQAALTEAEKVDPEKAHADNRSIVTSDNADKRGDVLGGQKAVTTEDRAAVTKSLETITGADTENEQATYLKNLIPVYTGGTPYGTSNKTEKMEKAADANRAYMANVPDSSYKELIGETVNHFTVAAFDRLENLSHQKGFGGFAALMGEIGSGDLSASSFYHLLPGTGNKAVQEDQQFYERQVDKFLNNKEWINNLNSSGFTNYDDQVGVTREFVSALTYAGIGNNTASRETLSILQNLEYNNLGSFGGAGPQGYVASPAVNSQPASTGHVSPLSGGLRISGGDRNGKAGADNDKGDSDSTSGTPPISLTH